MLKYILCIFHHTFLFICIVVKILYIYIARFSRLSTQHFSIIFYGLYGNFIFILHFSTKKNKRCKRLRNNDVNIYLMFETMANNSLLYEEIGGWKFKSMKVKYIAYVPTSKPL